jgi:hypothetical protein
MITGKIRSLRDHRRMGAALAKLPYGGEQPIVPLIACPAAAPDFWTTG